MAIVWFFLFDFFKRHPILVPLDTSFEHLASNFEPKFLLALAIPPWLFFSVELGYPVDAM